MMKSRFALASALILGGYATCLAEQPAAHWEAASTTASAITGDVTFTETRIIFAGGQSLPLTAAGSVPKFTASDQLGAAVIYKVTKPANLVLTAGNPLCGSAARPASATYIVIWHTKPIGADVDPTSMAVFSGSAVPHSDSDTDLCGIFNYEAGH